MLSGGYDSWNFFVPHTCTGTNDAGTNVRDQYERERGVLAFLESERTRIIDVDGNTTLPQPCSQFAIHDEMEIVEELYKAGELSFFANAGVLNKPVNKLNYNAQTRSQLFAVSKTTLRIGFQSIPPAH